MPQTTKTKPLLAVSIASMYNPKPTQRGPGGATVHRGSAALLVHEALGSFGRTCRLNRQEEKRRRSQSDGEGFTSQSVAEMTWPEPDGLQGEPGSRALWVTRDQRDLE